MVGILLDTFFRPFLLFWSILLLLWVVLFLLPLPFPERERTWQIPLRWIERDVMKTVFIMAAIVAFFGFWHSIRWNHYAKDEIGFLIPNAGSPVILDAYVDQTPDYLPPPEKPEPGRTFAPTAQTFFVARVDRLLNRGEWVPASGKIQVMTGGDRRDLKLGDKIRLRGLAWHPTGARNPGDYNQAFQLRSRRTLIQITANRPEMIEILIPKARYPIRRWIEGIRLDAHRRFAEALQPENATLASAMVLGIRSGIDDEMREEFRETGTSHLLAISGLHVALVTMFFLFILRLFRLSRRPTAILLASMILLYLMMTDRRPATIRAAVLIWVLCGGLFFKRAPLNVNSLAASGIIVLLLNPSDLFQTGVHLSFLATGVFLWFRPGWNPAVLLPVKVRVRWKKTTPSRWVLWLRLSHPIFYGFLIFLREQGKKLLRLLLISLTIFLVLLPIISRKLHLVAPVSILINPIIWIPLQFSLVFSFLLWGLGSIFPFLDHFLATGADLSFNLFRGMMGMASHLPGGAWNLTGPPLWWTVGFYLPLIFWTLFPSTRPSGRTFRRLLVLWIGIGVIVSLGAWGVALKTEALQVDILSVGHGGAMAIHYPDQRTVLYDCGTFSTPRSVARKVTNDLFAHGKTKVDLLILSHADADHYNGVVPLIESIPVGGVVVSPVMFSNDKQGATELKKALLDHQIPIYVKQGGETLEDLGFPSLRVFHPFPSPTDSATGANANSLTVGLEHLGRRVLFPGDLDAADPPFLHLSPIHFDLIVSPHHGGKSVGYEDLLRWTTPRVIVISGGLFQRYPETERQLRDRGYVVLNTFDHGAVRVRIQKPFWGKSHDPDGLGEMTILP